MQAVVACVLPEHENPNIEKVAAVHRLKSAANHVTKKSFGSEKSPQYAYVNEQGGTILRELEEHKREIEENKKAITRQGELLASLQHLLVSMEPLRETAVAIRRRFFHPFSKLTGEEFVEDVTSIRTSNAVAHEGNVLTDSTMITRGDLSCTAAFHCLYGIKHSNSATYLSTYPFHICRKIFTNYFRVTTPDKSY